MLDDEPPIEAFRKPLEGLAYRMTGSWVDAQDIAQETLLKWHALDEQARSEIRHRKAWLDKAASRLSLDRLKSASRARERYVGPWLPEPMLVQEESPADRASFEDSITMALMLTLERLTPSERASFLLHDVFGYAFEDISDILGKTAANCRKLASRGRASIRAERKRFDFDSERHRELIAAFAKAASEGDSEALESLLAEDVTLYSDGGGIAKAARRVLETKDVVTRLFIGLSRKHRKANTDLSYAFGALNDMPALFAFEGDELTSSLSISVSKGRISRIYLQRNPEKLAHLDARRIARD